MLDRQRIFVSHIHNAIRRPGSIRADDHSLDDRMRIALQHAAIHIGPRIAFVGVAHQNLAAPIGLSGEQIPFHSGREARPAPAAQSRRLDLGDNPARIAALERLDRAAIAARLQVGLDPQRVHLLVPRQQTANLPFVKRHLILARDANARGRIAIQQIVDGLSAKGGLDDRANVLRSQLGIEGPLRLDHRRRLHFAEAMAARDAQENSVLIAAAANHSPGLGDQIVRSAGLAASARRDHKNRDLGIANIL
ncbi:MAG: hypothetical protein BWZ10_01409 [candidate division BRC1 bacterium ADurb.BinA364]|nr:MAG: hypothetical protein BWZ10_01409 [candidate division BRC1 bacterium ADurb.BinA364]